MQNDGFAVRNLEIPDLPATVLLDVGSSLYRRRRFRQLPLLNPKALEALFAQAILIRCARYQAVLYFDLISLPSSVLATPLSEVESRQSAISHFLQGILLYSIYVPVLTLKYCRYRLRRLIIVWWIA